MKNNIYVRFNLIVLNSFKGSLKNQKMSSAVINSQKIDSDNMLSGKQLSKKNCNKILNTIKFDREILLNRVIYQQLIKLFIIDNENKDLNLIKTKINILFEPLSLNCWISFNNNNGKTIYKIVFSLDYLQDEKLNNINIYTCLNMINNYIKDCDDNKQIQINPKLYNYLVIYITKQKEKNDNYFETEYCIIDKFFSDNKINLKISNKSGPSSNNDYYELIFSKINTIDVNSIKTASDNNNNIDLITDNTNFPDLTDNKPTKVLTNVLNYSQIKKEFNDVKEDVIIDNVKKDDIDDDTKQVIIDDINEKFINDDNKKFIDNVKKNVIVGNHEKVIDDAKKIDIDGNHDKVIDDVKKTVIDVDHEKVIDDIEQKEDISNNVQNENISQQTISGVFCQGNFNFSGDVEYGNFLFTMHGIKNGNNLNLHFSINGMCDENGVLIRIPVKINYPFNEAIDNRNLMFSPVQNNC